MNLKKLEYITMIADEENISHAADRLCISRPALNHFLINLETEVGVPLFKRIHKKLIPTHIGKIYIKAARQILSIQKDTYKRIEDITSSVSGCISLGTTQGFGVDMLKSVLPLFLQRYSSYTIDLLEANDRELEQAVERGRIDFAVVGNCSPHASLEHTAFCQAEILLLLPPKHPLGYQAIPKDLPYASLDIQLLKNENFILMNSNTNVRTICNYHFNRAGYSPRILIECSSNSLAYYLVKQGLGASIILPPYHISNRDGVHFFSLEPREIWTHGVAFRKNTVFTKAESYFIELAKTYFKNAGDIL